MRTFVPRFLIPLCFISPAIASAATPINVTAGWNLVANSDSASINVLSRLGDQAKITTVWKWNKTASKWAFYAPSMTPAALATYAQSKNYDVLTSIAPKEGFWINAVTAAALTDPLAPPPVPGPALALVESDLQQGWNLVGSADNKNPSQLNTGLRGSLNAAGKAMVTAWAWDAPSAKWKFFAPTLEAQGGTALADYSTAKGYLSFNTAPAASDGFWLNIGPGTSTAPTGTSLELAKAFMTTLRSNVKALDATEFSLQTELQAVANDLKNRTAPIATSNVDALNMAIMGVQWWNDVIKNSSAPFVASKTFYRTANTSYMQDAIGGCGFYSDANYTILATGKSDANFVACGSNAQANIIQAIDVNGENRPCIAAGEWCRTQWSTRVRLHPDAIDANKFIVYTQTRESKQTAKTFAYSYFDATQNRWISGAASCPVGMNCSAYANTFNEARTHYGAAFPGNVATLLMQRGSNGQVTAASLTGEISPAFNVQGNPTSYYDGGLQRWAYRANQVATVFGDKHNVVLSGALIQVGTLDKLNVLGAIDLIKNGVLETRIELAEGSYLQATRDGTGSYSVQDGGQEMLLKLKAGTAASTFTGELKIGAFKLDASSTSYIPTLVSFAGTVQRNGVSFFDGTVTAEALNYANFNASQATSSNNVLTARVGFVGHVNIPTRTALQVNLAVTNTDLGNSAPNTAQLSGQYVQGEITINVSGTSSAASNIVTLESTSGVKLVLDASKTSFPLTTNGETVGVYSTTNKMLTYTDNSYEQF